MARIPKISITSNTAAQLTHSGGPEGSNPVPPSEIKLSEFITYVGRQIYGGDWTGEEIALSEYRVGEGWAGSHLECRLRESLALHKERLRRLASGYTRQEAMAQLRRDRWFMNHPEEDYAFIRSDENLVSDSEISKSEAAKVQHWFSRFIDLVDRIKERRQRVVVNGLRNALWSGSINASYLDLTGRLVAIDRDGWFQSPVWIERFVTPTIECVGLRSDGVRVSERRSILINKAEASAWFAEYSKTMGDPDTALALIQKQRLALAGLTIGEPKSGAALLLSQQNHRHEHADPNSTTKISITSDDYALTSAETAMLNHARQIVRDAIKKGESELSDGAIYIAIKDSRRTPNAIPTIKSQLTSVKRKRRNAYHLDRNESIWNICRSLENQVGV